MSLGCHGELALNDKSISREQYAFKLHFPEQNYFISPDRVEVVNRKIDGDRSFKPDGRWGNLPRNGKQKQVAVFIVEKKRL